MTLSVALMGTDLIGQARTGTGKTLAFGIPVLQRSVAPNDPDYAELPQGKPQALIVAPTRELALQVSSDLALASADRGMRVLTVYGGVGYDTQLDTLEAGVDIVVGTPGRLIDLCNRRALDISPRARRWCSTRPTRCSTWASCPTSSGSCAKTPETRQTMLFSATMPARDRRPGPHPHAAPDEHPRRVVVRHRRWCRPPRSSSTRPTTSTSPRSSARMLQAEDSGLTIVFTRTKRAGAAGRRRPDRARLRRQPAARRHGSRSRASGRSRKFREGKLRVLVATDVAARGIDVAGVTHVINYTCPEDEKTYVHRIGRTGRAGATGIAITFVDWATCTAGR